jgi:hypothetical protein
MLSDPIVGLPKVFGIGWAKTGTTTLGLCMETLGYRHMSQNLSLVADLKMGDLTRILSIASRFDSFDDWPWIMLFREMDGFFPNSRFILTKRTPDRWLRSYRNMLRVQGPVTEEMNSIRSTLYRLPFPDVTDGELLERYQRHNDEVQDYFRDRPNDLLLVNWEEGHGWRELCGFLGMAMPEVPFPHANRGHYD